MRLEELSKRVPDLSLLVVLELQTASQKVPFNPASTVNSGVCLCAEAGEETCRLIFWISPCYHLSLFQTSPTNSCFTLSSSTAP